MKILFALVLALVACSGPPRSATTPRPMIEAASWQIRSEDIRFAVGTRQVPGTIVVPVGEGPFPAILLLAGSGAIDRDWNIGAATTGNGSGKLLAERLARHGAIVLRFDRAGAGKNPGPHRGHMTLDTFREEALGALAALRMRPDVQRNRIFIAGHREGGGTATRAAARAPDIAGIIYLASIARPLHESILGRFELLLREPALELSEVEIRAQLGVIRNTLREFRAGKPVERTPVSTHANVQRLFLELVDPVVAEVTRVLLAFDNAREAAALAMPALIINGAKDIQVDPQLEALYLANTLRSPSRDVTLYIAPEADHVLKHEPRFVAELFSDVVATQTRYNEPGRVLDEDVVKAIVGWLVPRTK